MSAELQTSRGQELTLRRAALTELKKAYDSAGVCFSPAEAAIAGPVVDCPKYRLYSALADRLIIQRNLASETDRARIAKLKKKQKELNEIIKTLAQELGE